MKTTILGILTIVVAVGSAGIKLLENEFIDYATVIAAVTAGLGLLKAKDA